MKCDVAPVPLLDAVVFPNPPGDVTRADLALCVEGGAAGGEHRGAAGGREDR